MPQSIYNVGNTAFPAFRATLNAIFAAASSNNSGGTAPTTTYPFQLWADTTADILKMRNSANTAWINKGALSAVNFGFATLASPTFTGSTRVPTPPLVEDSDITPNTAWVKDVVKTTQYALVVDQKAAGTDAAVGSSGNWFNRELNTIVHNEIVGLSVSANRITLPGATRPGRYRIIARAPFLRCGNVQLRVRDVTNNVVLGHSNALYFPFEDATAVNITSAHQVHVAPIPVNITANMQIELQYRITAIPAQVLGYAINPSWSVPNERYAEVEIEYLDGVYV
jgi:hypothetical protein